MGIVSLKVGVVKQKFLPLFVHRIIRTPFSNPGSTTDICDIMYCLQLLKQAMVANEKLITSSPRSIMRRTVPGGVESQYCAGVSSAYTCCMTAYCAPHESFGRSYYY